jgi:RNA polymerase subunit RPABC4/transcription elongation factor Spt4
MTLIKFVRNYNDLSTERGFQFEFYCDRCGTGYQTTFQASATGMITEALDVAGGILGGVVGKVADVSDRVHSAAWEQAHDKAFATAVEEVKPNFRQCPKCTQWVCKELCWNEARGLCMECAPDVGVEMAAAQAEEVAEQAREQVREKTTFTAEEEAIRSGELHAACPQCGAIVPVGAKFCPECGTQITSAEKFCTECGGKIPAGAKFCPECGAKQG